MSVRGGVQAAVPGGAHTPETPVDAERRLRAPQPPSEQSRLMSLIEAVANVAIGYAVAVLTQLLVFRLFGLQASLAQNLAIGGIFTAVSIARSYTLRRVFEAIRIARGKMEGAPQLCDALHETGCVRPS